MQNSNPNNKPVVLVTGASQGIGKQAALIMARAGYHVIALARREEKLEELDDEIIKITGENATIVPVDIKDGAAIDRLGGVIFERYQKLDGLIHCAANLGDLTPVPHFTPREAQNIIDTNLTATFRLLYSMSALLEAAPNGRAIFMTSTVAKEPRPLWGLYGATKAGLENMVQAWAAEQTLNNIVATILNPGAVVTGMRRRAYPGEDQSNMPQPADLATMILELMSPNRDKSLNGARINFRDTEHYHAFLEKRGLK
jgi:short-subunit dehydrogenase